MKQVFSGCILNSSTWFYGLINAEIEAIRINEAA
jgi:hypothetical protein